MRKFVSLIFILLLVLAALLQFVLPTTVSNILKERIAAATAASTVDVSLNSNPNAKIALGEIVSLHATADNAVVSDIDFKTLTLDAQNVSVDIPALLFNDTLSWKAESATLRGVLTQDSLKAYISTLADKVDNASVTITPDEVTATGSLKIMGRMATVELAGNFLVEGGDVFFRMTRLDVTGTIIRNVQLEHFFGDVKILDSAKLPAGLHFESVELRDGEVIITAVN